MSQGVRILKDMKKESHHETADPLRMFARYIKQGWTCEFDDPFGVWIDPEGRRIESDHPESPLRKEGLI